MDSIKIGLDFGTHQTKICVQRIPDEGHGEPNYEFFQFKDLKGEKHYFLPSIVQINEDNTLSYGYVDSTLMKARGVKPRMEKIETHSDFDIESVARELIQKYDGGNDNPENLKILSRMLEIRKTKMTAEEAAKKEKALADYQELMNSYESTSNVFRYFKQATFMNHEWKKTIPCKILSIWYLAYVIFLLEEEFGTNFSINMGIPTDDTDYESKKKLATEILASAYYLVEDVFQNKLNEFLSTTIEELESKTVDKLYSDKLKDEYYINIFPEAYASLIGLTSRGKLPEGKMSLTADVGGGTTDISFFTIQNRHPIIYKYWSIDRGLNYIAEKSGFDYAEGDFEEMADEEIIEKYNRKKMEIVRGLIGKLQKQIAPTGIPASNLWKALQDRILLYSGGGSTYEFLNQPIMTFTDIVLLDATIWKEENVKDKAKVSKLGALLMTAYGLAVGKDDNVVKLKSFDNFFSHLPKSERVSRDMVSKECC